MLEAESDSDRGNDSSSVDASQVPLFVTVESPTNERLSGPGMALDEGSNGVWRSMKGATEYGARREEILDSDQSGLPHKWKRYPILSSIRLSLIFIKKSEVVEITVVEIQHRHLFRSSSFFPACRHICLPVPVSQRETSWPIFSVWTQSRMVS